MVASTLAGRLAVGATVKVLIMARPIGANSETWGRKSIVSGSKATDYPTITLRKPTSGYRAIFQMMGKAADAKTTGLTANQAER